MKCFLVDNGSLRADSWMNLCRVARAVSHLTGIVVEPASVLHSSRIPPAETPRGYPLPTTWERAVKAAMKKGEDTFWTLPFFFGPTGAIIDYLPQRALAIQERYGPISVRFAPFLADPVNTGGPTIADLLVERINQCIEEKQLQRPPVILVDHGSPKQAVTAVRDRLALELGLRLGDRVEQVQAASMERRDGLEYAFNEPLLETALRTPPFNRGDVVVAMLFLSPGRHAGRSGDIAHICQEAETELEGLRIHRTELLGNHPRMPELLAARLKALRWIEMGSTASPSFSSHASVPEGKILTRD